MKTYLYNRISSGRQSSGDGLIRQSESAEVFDFIKNHKLEVVERMVYTGSSFTGKNFDNETVLGKFIEDVKKSEITVPVCLCFENWDRFGRDVEWKNAKRFLDLIYAGVSIGVVSMDIVIDQKVLAENSSILQLVVNDIQRARKESQRKSGFSKRNIFVKVNRARNGEKIYFGGQSPRWITGVKNGEFVTDNEMVATIKRIFDLYENGKSCVGIAKILNEEKRQRFGLSRKVQANKKSKASWYNTTIRNILTNKALTGWCKINDFETCDYYPKIIDAAVFNRIQERVAQNMTNRGGVQTSGMVTNLFRGLTWCSCGGDVGVRYHRVDGKYYSYMGCRKAHVNLCKDRTWWPTDRFEEQIFFLVLEKSPAELLDKPKVKADSTLEKLRRRNFFSVKCLSI
jgi:DNA invertase Pin-like site-specific DNA recombinase